LFIYKKLSAAGMTAITTDFRQILIRRIFTMTAAILSVAADGAPTTIVRAFVRIVIRHKIFLPRLF
jgi:hypothetical protein